MDAVTRLGLEIRRARMIRGLSQRQLARAIGLTAHSNISEYERGLRIAPLDIVSACELVLATPGERLRRWHEKALEERADEWFEAQCADRP